MIISGVRPFLARKTAVARVWSNCHWASVRYRTGYLSMLRAYDAGSDTEIVLSSPNTCDGSVSRSPVAITVAVAEMVGASATTSVAKIG
jgi:hypothetical protein